MNKSSILKNELLRNLLSIAFIIISFFLLLNFRIVSKIKVDGNSMKPLLVDKEVYKLENPSFVFKGMKIFHKSYEIDDIIAINTDGILGYDTLNQSNIKKSLKYDSCFQDTIKETNDYNKVSQQCLAEDIIMGEPAKYLPIDENPKYIVKEVIYKEDINEDGIQDYYVRGINRDTRGSSIDSKNFGFIDGRYVIGKVSLK